MTVVSGSKSYPQSWCHMPTLFSEISEISPFCTSDDSWWLLAGFHQFSLSDLISGHQCISTITVMSSWSWYVKSYEVKCCYELPSPTNAQVQHDSCVRVEELPSKLVPHAYLIFRNKQDISCFAPLVTFGNFQQGFANFLCLTWSAVISVTQLSQSYHPEVDTSKVMKQNITMSFPAIQMHNSDMTVVSKLVAYPIFRNKWDISQPLSYFQQGFTNFLCLTWSVSQCNSTITVISSWSWYIKS